MRKVLGTGNPVDVMTKNLPRHSLDKCMASLSQHRAEGRAQPGLEVQGHKERKEVDAVPQAPASSATGLAGAQAASMVKEETLGKKLRKAISTVEWAREGETGGDWGGGGHSAPEEDRENGFMG